MYSRSFIRAHDRTTSNGDIRARSTGVTVGTPPVNVCFEGDPVACPACKSTGITKCVPPYRPSTGPDGRQANLDGDLCICKCFPPPRLKASFHNSFMGFESHEIATMPGASDWLAYAGHVEEITRYDQFFQAVDKVTGKPATGFSYGLKTNASEIHETLYTDGATAKAYSQDQLQVELMYIVQTEIGVRP